MRRYLNELYKRKDLILYLVTSGLKAQHRNTFLGYFWWLLDPLLGALIYYFIVVVVFRRGGNDYAMYLLVGIIAWRWFSSTVTAAASSIAAQAGIITQVYLPKAVFPLGATLTQLINFGFGLVVLIFFLLVFQLPPGGEVVWLPYIVLMQLLFSLAIAFSIAYGCVFVRDINTLISHLMRFWFFSSPVIWRKEMIPESSRWLVNLNPVAHFLESYRNALMYHVAPDYLTLFSIGAISAMMILSVLYLYSRYEHQVIKAL